MTQTKIFPKVYESFRSDLHFSPGNSYPVIVSKLSAVSFMGDNESGKPLLEDFEMQLFIFY